MLQTSSLGRLAVLIFLALNAAGCELVGGIFKAGVWVGALTVIAIVVVVVVAITKLKG